MDIIMWLWLPTRFLPFSAKDESIDTGTLQKKEKDIKAEKVVQTYHKDI